MSITRSARRQTFTVINNEIINDTALSIDAAFLLVWLLSKPDDWEVMAKPIQNRFGIGQQKLYRMLGELRDLGYASYKRHSDGHTDWIISETPINTPHTEKPNVETPHVDNQDVLVNTERAVNTENKLPVQNEFERWWKEYPNKKQKKPALTAFSRAVSKMDYEQISDFTSTLIVDTKKRIEFEDSWNRNEGQYIPMPTTYLNQERWTDSITPIRKATPENKPLGYQAPDVFSQSHQTVSIEKIRNAEKMLDPVDPYSELRK